MDGFWKYKLDHAIFWLATVGFHMFTKRDLIESAGVGHFLLEASVRNGLLAVLIYANLEILIPRYAQKGRLAAYVALLIGSLAAYVLIKNGHDVYLYGYVIGDPRQQWYLENTYYNFSIACFYLAFSVALHLSKAWYFQRRLIRQMELEKLNAELDYLRAQINPHFVFNSLNAIYFQIDRKNDRARKALSDFSEMLRYQLYECNGNEIDIQKEIAYIKSYVAMQQMRKDENYDICFSGSDGLAGFAICPLILIPFVENAFKHVSHFPQGNKIRISMDRNGDRFMFNVFNTKGHQPGPGGLQPHSQSEEAGRERTNGHHHEGIGLRNVRRRLDLVYKDRHELRIMDKPDSFEIVLSLQIDSNLHVTREP